MEFIAQQRSADSSLTLEQLAETVQKQFRIQVHPRSIQRRLLCQKKRRETILRGPQFNALRSSYEDLRAQVLAGGRGPGFALFLLTECASGGSLILEYCGRCCPRICLGDRQPATVVALRAIRDRRDSGRHVSGKAMGGRPMTHDAHQKGKSNHLKWRAYLYVRQSTLRQVLENTEITQSNMRFGNRASRWDGS